MTKETQPKNAVSEQDRFTAALGYVWILSLYTLFFRSKTPFIKFHAKQGTAIFILETVSFLFLFLAPFVIVVCVIASIWGIKEALGGKYWSLPFIGDWLKKADV